MTTSPAHVDSIILWTEEEARYLRAVLSWETLRIRDSQLGLSLENSVRRKPEVNRRPPVGEFRILVIGAKWTGKTSILTRVRIAPTKSHPHQSFADLVSSSVKGGFQEMANHTTPFTKMVAGTLWRLRARTT